MHPPLRPRWLIAAGPLPFCTTISSVDSHRDSTLESAVDEPALARAGAASLIAMDTTWRVSDARAISLRAPRVMAIINVTPDSFSDGGEAFEADRAVEAAGRAWAQGAAMLDVGGESTRPGAEPVSAAEQIRRVVPAISGIRAAIGSGPDAPPISVDTTSAEVAEAALDAGADAINDVSAGTADRAMLGLAARRGAGMVLMHRLRPASEDSYSDRYREAPLQGDIGAIVKAYLEERLAAAARAGIARERIVLDPGLGFGKTVEQNLELIRATARLLELGRPVLSGLSRKSFVARAAGMGPDSSPRERIAGTLGLSIAHVRAGARLLRVHDAADHARALAALPNWQLGEGAGGREDR